MWVANCCQIVDKPPTYGRMSACSGLPTFLSFSSPDIPTASAGGVAGVSSVPNCSSLFALLD